jgi:hypothetical protein
VDEQQALQRANRRNYEDINNSRENKTIVKGWVERIYIYISLQA